MVHIISKRDGPRKEDVAAKRLIENNRATIDRIANKLTGGGWQQPRATTEPAVERRTVSSVSLASPGPAQAATPFVRISPNDRVVVIDLTTGRQLHFIGEIRGGDERRFTLATRENGFFALVAEELRGKLVHLDGRVVPDEAAEELLKREIALGIGIHPMDEEAAG